MERSVLHCYLFFCHRSILVCINISSICFVKSCADSQNSLCNYCILTTTWSFWFSHEKHSSVQQIFYKPLPIDQLATLQAIVRSIQNVECISIIAFLLLHLQLHFNEKPSKFFMQLCRSTCLYFLYSNGKNLISELQCNSGPLRRRSGVNWWFLSYWLLCNRLSNSRKLSWHFIYKLIWHPSVNNISWSFVSLLHVRLPLCPSLIMAPVGWKRIKHACALRTYF